MAWTPEERSKLRESFFYDELIPRRNAMLQIADRIADANERGLDARGGATRGVRRTGCGGPWSCTFAVTLGGGILLAFLTDRTHAAAGARTGAAAGGECARPRRSAGALREAACRAQENERRTLARELHDEVGQSLSAILMEAESAACAADSGGGARAPGGRPRRWPKRP